MRASRSFARAPGTTYATLGLVQELFTALTSKLTGRWATAPVTTLSSGGIPNGKKSEQTTTSYDASISEL
jgi:hypothetical protein